jgi:hypothetical protein
MIANAAGLMMAGSCACSARHGVIHGSCPQDSLEGGVDFSCKYFDVFQDETASSLSF